MEYRALGTTEEVCHISQDSAYGHGMLVALAQFTCEQLSVKKLQAAIKCLQQSQPLLRACIEKKGIGHYLMIDSKVRQTPLQVIERKDGEQWKKELENQLNLRLKNNEYQWRMLLLNNPRNNTHELLLTINYSIADSFSVAALFNSLWQLYDNPEIMLVSHRLQPPVETHLTHLKKTMQLPPTDFLLTPMPYDQSNPVTKRRTRTECIAVPANVTKRVIAFCNKQDMSEDALFNALMLKALAQTFNKTISTYQHTLINLRPFCEPPIISNYLSSCASLLTTYHQTAPNTSLQELANQFKQQHNKDNITLDALLPIIPDVYKGHAMVITHSVMGLLMGNDRFSMGPMVSNIGQITVSGDNNSIHWQSLYFGNSQQAATIPVALNIALFHDHYMMSLSYTQPMLAEETAQLFIANFMGLMKTL